MNNTNLQQFKKKEEEFQPHSAHWDSGVNKHGRFNDVPSLPYIPCLKLINQKPSEADSDLWLAGDLRPSARHHHHSSLGGEEYPSLHLSIR